MSEILENALKSFFEFFKFCISTRHPDHNILVCVPLSNSLVSHRVASDANLSAIFPKPQRLYRCRYQNRYQKLRCQVLMSLLKKILSRRSLQIPKRLLFTVKSSFSVSCLKFSINLKFETFAQHMYTTYLT